MVNLSAVGGSPSAASSDGFNPIATAAPCPTASCAFAPSVACASSSQWTMGRAKRSARCLADHSSATEASFATTTLAGGAGNGRSSVERVGGGSPTASTLLAADAAASMRSAQQEGSSIFRPSFGDILPWNRRLFRHPFSKQGSLKENRRAQLIPPVL